MTAVPKFGLDRSIGSAVAKETPVAREKTASIATKLYQLDQCHGMTAVPKFGLDRSIGSAVAKETPVAKEKQRP